MTTTSQPTPEETGATSATAQSPTTRTGTSNRTPEQVVKRFLRALTERDLETIAALLAPEFEGFGPSTELRGENLGRELYLQLCVISFETFSNYRAELRNIISEGNQAVFEYIESATFTSPLHYGGKTLQPTGKSYRSQVAIVIRLNDDGLISEFRQYNDMLLPFRNQLGLDVDTIFPVGEQREEKEGINRWW